MIIGTKVVLNSPYGDLKDYHTREVVVKQGEVGKIKNIVAGMYEVEFENGQRRVVPLHWISRKVKRS